MDKENIMKKWWRLIRYDWPLHFVLLFTEWMPDNAFFLSLRGWLAHFFFGLCGHALEIGRSVSFYNPASIMLGSNIYIAHGCRFMANDQIFIEDEVQFGPYCVLVSGNHTRRNGSFRFGTNELFPITIEYGAWLGANVIVTAGVTVGKGTLVAAGSVVTRDIPDDVMAGGVPAKILKKIEDGV